MRYYKTTTSSGAVYFTRRRWDAVCCASIIYPLEEGGGLFPDITVDWYCSHEQCERHMRDWQRHGYRTEVAPVEEISAEDYALAKGLGPLLTLAQQ